MSVDDRWNVNARRLAALLSVPVLLVTAGCSSSDDDTTAAIGTLASVKVTGPTSAPPTVSFEAPITFEETADKLVTPGSGKGPVIDERSLVTVQYVAVNASDQSVFGSSWKSGPSTFYVNTVVQGFEDGLLGKHAGDRVLITSRPRDAFGATGNLESTVRPDDAVIFVVDILEVAPTRTLPATVPQLTYDADGNPSKFTADDAASETVSALGVYPIVEGPGPVIKAGDSISVEYFGQLYPDGKVFNGWTGQPFDLTLGNDEVIKGWDQGLVGQRVGSRVALMIPPDLGYGNKAQGSQIPKNSTLAFVVQIVSVS